MASNSSCITIVFGSAPFSNDPSRSEGFDTDEKINATLDTLSKHGVDHIDTAQLYGNSEQRLGHVKAGEKFIIDTKWIGGFSGPGATREEILKTTKESIDRLGVKQVDIFYIHAVDKKTPPEETLKAVDEMYKKGYFKRFGLSNYSAQMTETMYNVAKENGWVLPSVYQGNYNPVARLQETLLFPTLRKLGMAFYAYSPLAGGFLTKTRKQIEEGAGRFNKDSLGGMYLDMYGKPSYLEALEKWEKAAEEAGTSKASLAYRWVAYNSPLKKKFGDGIIVGASRVEQLDQTLKGLEDGPLEEKTIKAIDDIWETIKHEAPVDNLNRTVDDL